MTETGPTLLAWRLALPERLPGVVVGSTETRPGTARLWLAGGRMLIVQARFAEPERGTGEVVTPRIESVYINWGDRNGEGPSVGAALRDLLASGPPGAGGDTSLAGRWHEAQRLAAEMDAALARKDMEGFGRLYRRLLEALGLPRPKLAPGP